MICILCLAMNQDCPPLPADFVADEDHIREHLESVHDTPYPYSWESEDQAVERFRRNYPKYSMDSCRCLECWNKRKAVEEFTTEHRN